MLHASALLSMMLGTMLHAVVHLIMLCAVVFSNLLSVLNLDHGACYSVLDNAACVLN